MTKIGIFQNIKSNPNKAVAFSVMSILVLSNAAFAGNMSINSVTATKVELKNLAVIKTVDERDVQAITNSVSFAVKGSISCNIGQHVGNVSAMLGVVTYAGSNQPPNTVFAQHKAPVNVPGGQRNVNLDFKYSVEVEKENTDQLVNINLMRMGDIFEDKFQQHVSGGGSAYNYIKNPRSYEVTMRVSVVGACLTQNNQVASYVFKTVENIKINNQYQGTQGLIGTSVRSANRIKSPTPKSGPAFAPQTQDPAAVPKVRARKATARPTNRLNVKKGDSKLTGDAEITLKNADTDQEGKVADVTLKRGVIAAQPPKPRTPPP